jgi:pimeloyl-ACP methyl ester carboxylesterase
LVGGGDEFDVGARTRQIAAVRGVTRPEGGIARITAPVLVLSGDEDRLVKHRFAAPLWPQLVNEIAGHAG